jgi:hypothetical protein
MRCRSTASKRTHLLVRGSLRVNRPGGPSAVDTGLVMRLGRGIGMDVPHLPAIGAGVDCASFQSLDRSPVVATQHASKGHGDQLFRSRREAHRRACRSCSRDQPLASSTVIQRVLDCNPDPMPSGAPSVRGHAARPGVWRTYCVQRHAAATLAAHFRASWCDGAVSRGRSRRTRQPLPHAAPASHQG